MSRLTTLAIVIHTLSILCFSLWFLSIFITLRDHYKNWTLLLPFCISCLCLGFIPLVFFCTLLRSTAYANFWGVPKDEAPEKTWDYDLVSDYIPEPIQSRKYMFAGIFVFLYVWAVFAIIHTHDVTVGLVSVLSSALGGFCVGELFKVGPAPRHALTWAGGGAVDFGFFNYVVANAVCTAQRLFGFNTKYMWIVFGFSMVLISFHSATPRCVYIIDYDEKQQPNNSDVLEKNTEEINHKVDQIDDLA